MKRTEVRVCATCDHYVEMQMGNNPVAIGFCRRYPPIPVLTDTESNFISSHYPQVERNEWCGEFSKR